MSEIKIDRGVPIPKPRKACGAYKDIFYAMQIGDSFFVPGIVAFSTHKTYEKKLGHTYVSRKVWEGGESGMRIWRVS